MTRRSPARVLVLLIAIAPMLAACLPNRIVLDLAPGDGEIEETAVLTDDGASARSSKIALIDVSGLLSLTPQPGVITPRSNSVDSLVTRLSKAADDPATRAVILWVNSPGGTVGASETMYAELRHFREKTGKPIVVCMAEIATSGAFYISLAADHVIAQPSTVTGSIGVLVQTFNFSEGMSRIGITGRAVTSGPNKALTNPFEPPSDEHFRIVQDMVNEFYEQFRSLVAENRPEAAGSDRFDTMTDGRVVTGTHAAELGLIDQTGSLRDAFTEAKRLAGVERARLVKYHAQGLEPRSPYGASASASQPSIGDTTTVNVLSVGLTPDSLAPGFYYVWWPLSP